MLLETALALEELLKTMSASIGLEVTVTTDEGYAETIATSERKHGKVKYPVIVMRSGEVQNDPSRYVNDFVDMGHREVTRPDGSTVTYNEIDAPMNPYVLKYQIDLIAESRRDIDAMEFWVMQNIKDRDYLDVKYNDNGTDAIYCSYMKRGSIIRADDKDGNATTLRRRIFELTMTTLIPANRVRSEIMAEHVNVTTHLRSEV